MRKIKHDKQCTISFQKKKKKKEKERNTQPLSDKLLKREKSSSKALPPGPAKNIIITLIR